MEKVTSFSDKFLIMAAIDYSYRMSRYDIHENPIEIVKKLIGDDFKGRYKPIIIENKPIKRLDENNEEVIIQLRYLLVEDSHANPFQYALIYQGSDVQSETIFSGKDTDWSNNLSTAVHLPTKNYKTAQDEFSLLASIYNITAISGNSLGGGYALSLAEINPKLRIIGINPAPPEFNTKFKDTNYSTIINTSTDLLTRMLKTDISRYKEEDYQKIKSLFAENSRTPQQKTKEFDEMIQDLDYQIGYYYGLKTYPVERSLYYNEILYVEAAHRGTVLEPREVALDIFSHNLIPYSTDFASKIFSQTKELLDYSRYFIKLSTNVISNKEYRDLVDNYIIKAFKPVHKNKLQDYKEFNSLATFIQYDIKSKNLISEDGSTLVNDLDLEIINKEKFIDNLNISVQDYKKSIAYPINRVIHDIEEEIYMSKKESNLNQIMTFFASSFNITINFDLDIFQVFKGLPVTILFKIAELLDQNRKYLKGLKTDLLKYFSDKNKILTNQETIEHYRNIFTIATKTIDNNTSIIVNNLEKLSSNFELVLRMNISKALGFRYFQGKQVLRALEDLEGLDIDFSLKTKVIEDNGRNLVISQYDQVLDIIDNYRIHSTDELSENIKKSQEIVKSSIQYIDKQSLKKEEYHLNKLSMQLKAMLENVDLATIYYNALNVFRHDIAAVALRNTVGQSIVTHYRQAIETNQQLEKMLKNLKLYVKVNTSSKVRSKLLLDIEHIENDLEMLNTYITSFIE